MVACYSMAEIDSCGSAESQGAPLFLNPPQVVEMDPGPSQTHLNLNNSLKHSYLKCLIQRKEDRQLTLSRSLRVANSHHVESDIDHRKLTYLCQCLLLY